MRILLFGIAKDIAGAPTIDASDVNTVAGLKSWLYERYPQLKQLKSLLIAVNKSYADDAATLAPDDEIAVIPPVSGG
jgi:molybdopterin converting factor subunit 1